MQTAVAENHSKLVKVLNLLASDQPGEVVSAARQATRYLAKRGLSWKTLITPEPQVVLSGKFHDNNDDFILLDSALIIKRTAKANWLKVRLENGGLEKLWFPKSQIKEDSTGLWATPWILEQKENELFDRGVNAGLATL